MKRTILGALLEGRAIRMMAQQPMVQDKRDNGGGPGHWSGLNVLSREIL
jgi:hypothetical protein